MNTLEQKTEAFKRLLTIMDELRAQCPWDKSQTLETLRYLTIEEMYELSDSILDKDMDGIGKELGDLMLHIVFYAKIGSESGSFDMGDVLNGICEKLIRRHPHIYGDVVVQNSEDVKNNWEAIKMEEGHASVLSGVPLSLPAMVKAYRIQEKVRGVGFDWENQNQVWEKVEEEIHEFRHEAISGGSPEKLEDEFGDVLFSLINYARFIDVNPEDALERTNKKFIKRFKFLEQEALRIGKTLREMTLAEMDVFWNQAKESD